MKIIFDSNKEFELTKIDSAKFIVVQKKTDEPLPLPYKEDWNDPTSPTIQRIYKSIKIGEDYYGIKTTIG